MLALNLRKCVAVPSPPPLFSPQVYPPIQTPRDGSHGNPRRPLAEWKFTVDLRNLLRLARPRAMERAKRKCTAHCALPKTTLFTPRETIWRICECFNAKSSTEDKHIYFADNSMRIFLSVVAHWFEQNVYSYHIAALKTRVENQQYEQRTVEIAEFRLWLIPSVLAAKLETYMEALPNFTSVWTINSLI